MKFNILFTLIYICNHGGRWTTYFIAYIVQGVFFNAGLNTAE